MHEKTHIQILQNIFRLNTKSLNNFSTTMYVFFSTVSRPVNKDHPKERLNMSIIDKWSLFGGFTKKKYLDKTQSL
jgi:hypothetical protein